MWRRQKRMQARSCWTWRSRRNSGRVTWRTWRKIWGRRRPKAKWWTQICSILLVISADKAKLYKSIPFRPLTASQIPAAGTWDAEKGRAGPSDSSGRGGWGHNRDHSLSNVRLSDCTILRNEYIGCLIREINARPGSHSPLSSNLN